MSEQCITSCELTHEVVGVGKDGKLTASRAILSRAASYSQFSGSCYYADHPPFTHVVYAFFLASRELHAVTIDPLPPSTPPARDAVPNHPRTSLSSTRFESAVSSVSTNNSPSGRSHTTSTSHLVPATRLRSELEGENRADALPHPPEIRPCAPFVLFVSISLSAFIQSFIY
jgi:hypothetical protein